MRLVTILLRHAAKDCLTLSTLIMFYDFCSITERAGEAILGIPFPIFIAVEIGF